MCHSEAFVHQRFLPLDLRVVADAAKSLTSTLGLRSVSVCTHCVSIGCAKPASFNQFVVAQATCWSLHMPSALSMRCSYAYHMLRMPAGLGRLLRVLVSLETSSIIVRWVRSDHRIRCAEFGIVAREPDAFRSRGKWSAACSSWLLVQDGYPAIGSHSCLYCGRHKPDKALSELLFAWLSQAWNPGIVAVTLMMPLLYTAACKRGSCVPVRLGKCYAVAHHSLSVCTGVSCASDPITCRFQKRTAALVGGMHAECSRGSHTVHA